MSVEALTYAALGARLKNLARGRSFACQATPVAALTFG
jgi:hypothetical protein